MSPNGGRSALTAYILICAPTEVGGGFSLSAAPQFWQKYTPVCTAAWHDGHIKISWLSIIHLTSYHIIDLDGPPSPRSCASRTRRIRRLDASNATGDEGMPNDGLSPADLATARPTTG